MGKIRLTLLGIFCAGLLLGGIGAGVAFSTFSSFTYAGKQVIDGAEVRSQRLEVPLESDAGPVRLNDYFGGGSLRLRDVGRIEVSEAVPAGTLLWEMTYETAGPEISVWTDFYPEENQEWVHLSWSGGNDLALLLACKNQVLSDIRAHRIGEYLPARLGEAVISVNPADADRVSLE